MFFLSLINRAVTRDLRPVSDSPTRAGELAYWRGHDRSSNPYALHCDRACWFKGFDDERRRHDADFQARMDRSK